MLKIYSNVDTMAKKVRDVTTVNNLYKKNGVSNRTALIAKAKTTA